MRRRVAKRYFTRADELNVAVGRDAHDMELEDYIFFICILLSGHLKPKRGAPYSSHENRLLAVLDVNFAGRVSETGGIKCQKLVWMNI